MNGVIKVYRYETLGSDPDVIVLGARSFPVKDVTGDESGVYRFFKIVLE